MLKYKALNIILIFGCLFLVLLLCFPVLSTYYSDDTFSGEIIVRGFNLIGFDSLSCLSFISPLLVPIILRGHMSNTAKEIILIILLICGEVGYFQGLNFARLWLYEIVSSVVTYHFPIAVYPIAVLILTIISLIMSRKELNNGQ